MGYGRTQSLCIIGTEEIGKAFLYTIAALDAVPGLRGRLAGARKNPAREHELKHLLEEFFFNAADLVREYLSEIDFGEYGTPGRAYLITQIIKSIVEDPSSEILKKPLAARKHFEETKNILPLGDNLSTEERKWRGLYVDILNGEKVHSPSAVSEMEARMALIDLETSVKEISVLKQVLASDEEWEEVKQEIGSELS